jgi:hypothetical protein
MKVNRLIKILLLIFIVVSTAFLIYKEFLPRNESNATEATEKQTDTTPMTENSKLVSKNENIQVAEAISEKAVSSTESTVIHQKSKVIAYYFHGNFRCTTCRTIEQYSHDAIHSYFARELESEKMEFRSVNVEEPENRHLVQKYQLFSKSLVLSLVTDSEELKWKNLTDVWTLVSNKDKFFQYVKDEVEIFLKET